MTLGPGMQTFKLGLRPVCRIQPTGSWSTPVSLRNISQPKRASFASQPNVVAKPKRRIGLKVVATVIVLGAGYMTFTESGRFYYEAIQRTTRVAKTLAANINEYVFACCCNTTQIESRSAIESRSPSARSIPQKNIARFSKRVTKDAPSER